MTHLLAMGSHEKVDDDEDLVRLNDVPEQVQIDMTYYGVPNDAAFLKYFTPQFVSSNGAKPRYMWAGREFESSKSLGTFPSYMVTGFGLLDAFMHAHATNSTLVLHPLDIVLSVCYAYGGEKMKPISQNNSELKNPLQITLKQDFTRSNLLLAIVIKLARRVETFPLAKLYNLINAEMNSPDPMAVRLVLGVLSYLSATKETSKLTLNEFNNLFDLQKQSKADQLLESQLPTRVSVLDVRHDSSAPTTWKATVERDTPYQQSVDGVRLDNVNPAGANDEFNVAPVSPGFGAAPVNGGIRQQLLDTANQNWVPSQQGRPCRSDKVDAFPAAATAVTDANAAAQTADVTVPNGRSVGTADDVRATDDMKILGNWQLNFDSEDSNREVAAPSHTAKPDDRVGRPDALGAFRILNSDTTDASQKQAAGRDANNSNCTVEQEAAEWFLKPRVPSRLYKVKKENGIHSVLFKGSQTAWLELPEMLHELCHFFMLDSLLQTKIIDIALAIQKTRLNPNRSYRKWWQKALFKDGYAEPLPDGDFLINGWLALLLGERSIAEQCPMTVNKLSDLKACVKLPILLVRLPLNALEDTDDPVLESESGQHLTRLQYYDEYREKLGNSCSNANEVPIGLFMPWRSTDALIRTRKLWRQVGGDAPATLNQSGDVMTTAKNRNNMDNRPNFDRGPGKEHGIPDEEVTIKTWTAKRQSSTSTKSGLCSCCGGQSRRRQQRVTEPMYNMSCLLTGVGGFCLQQPNDLSGTTNRTRVRPLCFIEIAHEE